MLKRDVSKSPRPKKLKGQARKGEEKCENKRRRKRPRDALRYFMCGSCPGSLRP